MTLLFLCVLCVLGGCVLFGDACDAVDQARDLSCLCGRRDMKKVVCDAARAQAIERMLSRNCPWCSNQSRCSEPRTSVRAALPSNPSPASEPRALARAALPSDQSRDRAAHHQGVDCHA